MTTKIPPELVADQVIGRRNLIINGDMRVAQRGTSTTTNGSYTCDRFYNDYNGGTVTYAQSALSSSDTPYSHGFRSAVKITNTSAGSDAAANYVRFQQKIEATNLANSGWNYTSATSFVTLSFWVKSSLAGTYAIQIYNVDSGAKSYSFEFTLSANTWTKVTHAIKGDSGVVINDDSGEGLGVHFFVHAGTNYSTSGHTNEAWQTYSGSDQVKDYGQSWSATASATFEITGVQLEVGSQATPFEYRSLTDEINLCQRYYEQSCGIEKDMKTTTDYYASATAEKYNYQGFTAYNNGLGYVPATSYRIQKRIAPSVTLHTGTGLVSGSPSANQVLVYRAGTWAYGAGSVTTWASSEASLSFHVTYPSISGGQETTSQLILYGWVADAEI